MPVQQRSFKKMAGTAAVFLIESYDGPSPVERDGMRWSQQELGISGQPHVVSWKPAMDNTLALEGLEEYDPARDGDVRFVHSVGVAFIYSSHIRGWVQVTHVI